MIKFHKFPSLFAAEHHMNGGISAGLDLRTSYGLPEHGPGFYNLVGKTLIFTQPTPVTVTFVAGSIPGFLKLAEVLAQIRAAVAGTTVSIPEGGRLHIVETTPTNGVSITGAGTANSILGFSTGSATTGRVYGADPTVEPAILNAYESAKEGSHIVVTVE